MSEPVLATSGNDRLQSSCSGRDRWFDSGSLQRRSDEPVTAGYDYGYPLGGFPGRIWRRSRPSLRRFRDGGFHAAFRAGRGFLGPAAFHGSARFGRRRGCTWTMSSSTRQPLRPERVCEVAYDQMQGTRFRHAANFLRWRPDKRPQDCRYDQLEVTPAYELDRVFGARDSRSAVRRRGPGIIVRFGRIFWRALAVGNVAQIDPDASPDRPRKEANAKGQRRPGASSRWTRGKDLSCDWAVVRAGGLRERPHAAASARRRAACAPWP